MLHYARGYLGQWVQAAPALVTGLRQGPRGRSPPQGLLVGVRPAPQLPLSLTVHGVQSPRLVTGAPSGHVSKHLLISDTDIYSDRSEMRLTSVFRG